MTKYTVTFDVAIYAERPSDAVVEAVQRVYTGTPHDAEAWNLSFHRTHGTAAITGAEHSPGKLDGWRMIAVVKEHQ